MRETPAERFAHVMPEVMARHGSSVIVTRTKVHLGREAEMRVRMWSPNGLCHERDMRIAIEGLTDDAMRTSIERQIGERLVRASKEADRRGPPRELRPDEIDTTAFEIERPVAAALRAMLGTDARGVVLAALAVSSKGGANATDGSHGPRSVRFEVNRNRIQGRFKIIEGARRLEWCNGSLTVVGVELPPSALSRLAHMKGVGVGAVIASPLIAPDMPMSVVHHVARSSGPRLHVETMRCTVPFDAELPPHGLGS